MTLISMMMAMITGNGDAGQSRGDPGRHPRNDQQDHADLAALWDGSGRGPPGQQQRHNGH